ncbi:hypothetical protein GCM10011351_29950 [Paraliobacillus quinghaiensis]|uniref:Thioredoxin domain-containing protein n=1 Tax=Paraliobacillus quinghaiensis TaxID=470815 RepID=A0A917TYK9_9BACI|nr:thioredoxin family protein [Paraliobacillus quinghaiensis]GGM41848.1 hypothetical protein GCM10011351_29950 [Paraliobacillus quinghaiensis]
MKKTLILVGITLVVAVLGIILLNQYKTVTVDSIDDIDKIDYQDTYTQDEGDYLIYFWQEGCSYCEEVAPDIIEFAQDADMPIRIVDMQAPNNHDAWYDWETHHEEYDVKIGEVVDEEEQLNEGVELTDYTEDAEVFWRIGINEQDEIIATHNTPYGNTEPATADEIEITGTPTLIQVKDGAFSAYANGPEEVRNLLEENK